MMMDPGEALLRSRCKEAADNSNTSHNMLEMLDGGSCFQLIFNQLCRYAHFHDQHKWISIN